MGDQSFFDGVAVLGMLEHGATRGERGGSTSHAEHPGCRNTGRFPLFYPFSNCCLLGAH